MLTDLNLALVRPVIDWLNANEGLLALMLFVVSALFAWFSGILTALRRRPRLRIATIPGPTMFTVHDLGTAHEGYPAHRVSISIYVQIANAGSAPTSIGDIHVSYSWMTVPFSKLWWRRLFVKHWITSQMVALRDFQVALGDSGDVKVYPFLTQRSTISGDSAKTYLEVGEMTNGVIYFEESEAFGACQPRAWFGQARMKLKIFDAFGGTHTATIRVPSAALAEARKYNPSFGSSLDTVARKPAGEDV